MSQSRKRTPKEVRGSLIGTLLGDSYITQGNMFGCEQTSKGLIELKRELLRHYKADVPAIAIRQRENVHIDGRKLNCKPTYSIRMRHPRFKRYGHLLYKHGSRQVSYSMLKFISLEGLALWIMDDGYMDYEPRKRTRNLRLCTDAFDGISIDNIIRYFKEYHEIEAKVYSHVNKKGAVPKRRISFNAKNAQKLIAKIYPYFLDEFLYKIDLHYLPETLDSMRCSDEYRVAANYISQRKALSSQGE